MDHVHPLSNLGGVSGLFSASRKDCIDGFSLDEHGLGTWRFRVPTGQGNHVNIRIHLELLKNSNAIRMIMSRLSSGNQKGGLNDNEPVQLILRPDIENRNFHETTKAYQGPEHRWPSLVEKQHTGFIFKPDKDHILNIFPNSKKKIQEYGA